MPRRRVQQFIIITLLLWLGACARQYKPGELASDINIGGTYYTQFSLFEEKNEFRTTNYRRGVLIPINTPVTLVSIDKKRIAVKLAENGQPLTVVNMQKHTGEDSQQAFRKIFGKRKVELARFRPEERDGILAGQVRNGMSKKAVLAAIGYPPVTRTPSLQADEWTYWASRHDRFIVRFKHDQVVDLAD